MNVAAAENRQAATALVFSATLHLLMLAAWRPAAPVVALTPPPLLFNIRAARPPMDEQVKRHAVAEPEAAPAEQPVTEDLAVPPAPLPEAAPAERAQDARPRVEPIAASAEPARKRPETSPPVERLDKQEMAKNVAQPAPARPLAQPPPAARPAEQVAATATSAAASQSRQARVRARYEQRLFAWLSKFKEYPLVAQRRRLEGTGVLRVRISRDGRVISQELSRETRHPLLNEAAMRTVRRAAPFPPVPADYPGETFEFLAPVEFTLR